MIILTIILFLLLLLVSFYCIKFAILIINLQEGIEDSLNIIDEKYESLNKILEIPVFYDSPEIKKVISDLEETRLALLYIANLMTNEFESVDKQKGSEESLDGKRTKEEKEK